MTLYSKLILPLKLRKLWLKAVLVIGNQGMTDKTFQSGSLLLVYQNISTVAHFTEKLQKISPFSVVNPSGQNLGHFTLKFSTSYKNVKVGIWLKPHFDEYLQF